MSLMSSKKLLMQGARKLRPQDVFATGLYSGDGAARSFSPGIDLAGKGGLLWLKRRSGTAGASPHSLFDTVRGMSRALSTDATNAENAAYTGVSATPTGWALASTPSTNIADLNAAGANYVNWYFRRAKKFFDIVPYTGNGQSGRQIPHGLGDVPGMIIIKKRNSTGGWPVSHRALGVSDVLYLNTTDAKFANAGWFPSAHTASAFTVGSDGDVNGAGNTYVAYLFAHNPDLIDCGSYTGNAADIGPAVTCGTGWQPQFLLIKNTEVGGTAGNWVLHDSAREPTNPRQEPLFPNLSSAQGVGGNVDFLSTGFRPRGTATATNGSAQKHVFMAIRSPT